MLCFVALRRRVENWLAGPGGLSGGAVRWLAQAEAMEAGKYRSAREKWVRSYEVKIVYQERDAGEYDGNSKKSRRWIMQEISDVEEREVGG